MHFVTGRSAADIAASVERAIRTGQVSPGEQLPSVREVAERLGVNRNTVTAAYARLRDAGLVTGNGRQGSRVAGTPSVEIYRTIIPADVRDLASGNVDASLLPDLRPWLAALDLAPGGYEMVEDDPDLVRFATHAFRTDGLPAGRVAVVSGAMDGLERGLRAHLRQGDAIGIEDPGYVSALLLVRSLGLKPVPLPLDDDGVQVEALEAALAAGIRGVVLTPGPRTRPAVA
ncbi:GntR family transcriptional regulator [Tistrella bauzanensis]